MDLTRWSCSHTVRPLCHILDIRIIFHNRREQPFCWDRDRATHCIQHLTDGNIRERQMIRPTREQPTRA